MPIFGKLFYGLFAFLFQFLAKFIAMEKAAKVAQFLTFMTMMLAIWTSFRSCAGVSGSCGSAIAGIASMPYGQWFMIGLGIVFNGKTWSIVSCYLSIWLATNLYIFKKKMWTMIV